MEINLDGVTALAKLKINDNERTSLTCDMKKIIAFASELDISDDTLVQTSCNSTESILREDISIRSLLRDELLVNAAENDGRYITVPRTVE